MTAVPAAVLRRMIAQVRSHVGADVTRPHLSQLHLEHHRGYLYAVATDHYTMAVTRTRVSGGEAWAGAVPADQVRPVADWLRTARGDVTVGPDGGALTLTGGDGDLRVEPPPPSDGEFPAWRPFIRRAVATTSERPVPITAYTTAYLARWRAADTVLVAWQAGPLAPLVLASRDGNFVGVQQPCQPQTDRGALAGLWLADLGPDQDTGSVVTPSTDWEAQ